MKDLIPLVILSGHALIASLTAAEEGTHIFREVGKWKVEYTVDADGQYVSSELTETAAKDNSFILALTDHGTTVSFKGAGLAASEEAIPLTYSFSAELKPTAGETAAAVTTTADTIEHEGVWAVFSAADDASAALMTGFSTSGFCHIEAGEKKWTLDLDATREAVESLLECHSAKAGLEFDLEETKRYRISAGNSGEKALTYTIFLSLE